MSDYQLSQIAIMHYENGLSQQEIANLLGMSKMTVSRILQKAKDQGIVQTQVKLPFHQNKGLEKQLISTYNLIRAWVIRTGDFEEPGNKTSFRVVKAAAFVLNTAPPVNSTIGVGIGKTVGMVVKNLVPVKTENIHVVQLMGGLPDVTKENPFSIIQETCRKWDAAGTFLTSFATAESQDTRDSFFQNTEIGQMIYRLWKKCDRAIFGIGAIEKGTLLSPKLVNNDELQSLKEQSAVGDVLGHCFDAKGNFIDSNLEDRLVSIPIELLMNIPDRRAIALGDYKVPALRGALRAGIITELFTDEETAQALLDEK